MIKLFILGLDGARLDVVERWVEEGHLPHFKDLIESGVSGNLNSVLPGPHSGPAWTSFATGRKPGKHGIPYFWVADKDYSLRHVMGWDIRNKKMWNYLSDSGENVGVINVPMTGPPEEVNGVMVSSWTAPFTDISYPAEIKEKLDEYVYQVTGDCFERTEEALKNLYDATEARINFVKWFLNNHDWNLCVSVFIGTEQLHHLYASFLDEEHPQYDPDFEEIVLDYYERLDKFVGFLTKNYSDTNLMVVSDHGFCPENEVIYINEILKELGYLVETGGQKTNIKQSAADYLVHNVGGKVYHAVPGKARQIIDAVLPKSLGYEVMHSSKKNIGADWSRTKAFCPGNIGNIYLNVEGRYESGCVPENDYEEVRDEIITSLKNHAHLEKVVEGVYRREEVFHGPATEEMPDIYVHFKDGYKVKRNLSGRVHRKIVDDRVVGGHTMKGIFLAKGPDILESVSLDIDLTDIFPTVLHLFGLPIPKDMDGDVKRSIFKEGSQGKEEPTFTDAEGPSTRGPKDLSRGEENEVRQRLEDLGYLE